MFCSAGDTYGASSGAVEALLALNGNVSTTWGLELHIESGCNASSVRLFFSAIRSSFGTRQTLAGVVEVLVDELCLLSAHLFHAVLSAREQFTELGESAYVVGGLAEVTESWDWQKRRKRSLGLVLCGGEEAAHVVGGGGFG